MEVTNSIHHRARSVRPLLILPLFFWLLPLFFWLLPLFFLAETLSIIIRDVLSGTSRQEIDFWLQKERVIHSVYEQYESVPIKLTFRILEEKKCSLVFAFTFLHDVGMTARGRFQDPGMVSVGRCRSLSCLLCPM